VNWGSVALNVGLGIAGGAAGRALSGAWRTANVVREGVDIGLAKAMAKGAAGDMEEVLGKLSSSAIRSGGHRAAVDVIETQTNYAKNLVTSTGGLLLSVIQANRPST
jgi:hypothetical protein